VPVPQSDREDIVAVGKDVRLDGHFIANDPFYGKTPAIDARPDVLDDDAYAAFVREVQRGRYCSPPLAWLATTSRYLLTTST
jgi:hypothetical protein